jgi:hypothetical protein
MRFLENQTLKMNVKFVKNSDGEDQEKRLGLNLSLSSNHELDKNLISQIEKYIKELVLLNYEQVDNYSDKKKEDKEREKIEAEAIKKAEQSHRKMLKIQEQNEKNAMKLGMKNDMRMRNILKVKGKLYDS